MPPSPSSPVMRIVRYAAHLCVVARVQCRAAPSSPSSSTFLSVKPLNCLYAGSPFGTFTYLPSSFSAAAVRSPLVALAVLVASRIRVGLEVELLADPQQLEGGALRGDRAGAAVGLEPHVQLVRAAPGDERCRRAAPRRRRRRPCAPWSRSRSAESLPTPFVPASGSSLARRQHRPSRPARNRAHQCGPAGTARGIAVTVGLPLLTGVRQRQYGSVPWATATGGAEPSGPPSQGVSDGTG